MSGTRTLRIAVGALAIAAAAPAIAQSAPGAEAIESSPILGKLENCITISDDAERLACFDREVGVLVGATTTGEVKVIDAESIKQARRGLFGFRLPKIGLFGGGDEEEVKILESTVTKVRQVAPNEWHFWIAEGNALWRIKNSKMGFRPPEVNDEVEFKPASMGTYWIRIDGRTGVRGERIG